MILACTACQTRYLVNPTAIGPSGRYVRCAGCGHTWFQDPPARDILEKAAALAPSSPAKNIPSSSPTEGGDQVSQSSPPTTRSDNFRSSHRLPAVIHPHSERRRLNWRLIVPVLLGIMMAVALLGKDWIQAALPPSIPLYQALGLK